jgi:hypothetical protein
MPRARAAFPIVRPGTSPAEAATGPARQAAPGPCPASPARLSPGQIVGLQRQIGNRAVQQLLAKRGPASAAHATIQRAVGFEFEVSGYQVNQLTNNLTQQQKNGTANVAQDALGEQDLVKGLVLANGQGFTLQIDEGANDYHLEFVTADPGFAETKTGRNQLKQALNGMETLARGITTRANTPGGPHLADNTRLIETGEIAGGVAHQPERVISSLGAGPMSAEPQTTAGIRLDQIPALMENMAAPAGENQQEKTRRAPARSTLASKSSQADTNAMRAAAPAARAALATFRQQMQQQNVVLNAAFGSDSLVGLMSLIYTYLTKATVQVNDYPKSLFPLLGITNFGTMYSMLPAADKVPFTGNAARFADLNLAAANMAGAGDTAFFAGGFGQQLTNMTQLESQQVAQDLGAITRNDWLTGIVGGVDELTRAQSGVDALESMGKLNRGEQVGDTHWFRANTVTNAPILELRRNQRNLGVNNWKDFALDIYDFIVKLNDRQTGEFSLRRYNPRQPK